VKRAKQLGAVVFSMNSLFIREEESDNDVMGEVAMSAAGSHIVFQAAITTPYITLESKQYGWVTEEQRDALRTMRKTLGATYTLTYTDLSTVTVRMATEKEMVFTPLYEGAKKYTAVIPLAKA
jgi:hypothetical protein